MKCVKLSVILSAALAARALPVLAQAGPPGGPGGGGPGGPPDFAEMRQHMLEDIRQDLNVTDAQWKTLSPQIEKIQQLHDDVTPHGFGPPGPPPDQQEQSSVRQALDDLRDALDSTDSKPEDILAKISAYEAAKAKAIADLKKAEDALKAAITPRQTGVLVADGVLD